MAFVDPRDDGLATADSGPAFTLRYALPGLVAGTVMAIGALGVGWLPIDGLADVPLVHALRTDTVGAFVSRASVILGGALLLQAWLVVGADVLAGHVRDIRRLWAVLAIWIAPFLLAPPLFSRDAYSYFAQGKLVLNGVDPYTNGVSSIPGWFRDGVDPMWSETPTPYGPLFLAMSRGVAAFVGEQPYLAVIAFRLLAVAGVALLAFYIPRLAFHCGIDASKALWLGVMNPLVLMHFVSGAHNDALMIGLIIAGLVLAIEGRPGLGVVLVTLGCDGQADRAARDPVRRPHLGRHARRAAPARDRLGEVARGRRAHLSASSRSPSAWASAGSVRSPPPARCARGSRRPPRSACSAATCSTGSASATTSTPRWRCSAAWA